MASQDHLEFWSCICISSKELGASLCCIFGLNPGSRNVLHVRNATQASCRPMLEILSPGTCSFFAKYLSHLQRLFVYTGYNKLREDLSNDHSIFQNALCISGITAAFCDTSDAVKNRFQAKCYSSDSVDTCFISATLYSLQRSRCQNPEVDPEAKQKWQCTNNRFFSIIICPFSLADLPLLYATCSHI